MAKREEEDLIVLDIHGRFLILVMETVAKYKRETEPNENGNEKQGLGVITGEKRKYETNFNKMNFISSCYFNALAL